jgi:glutamate/tyrosine decarboxylase-like PLP-dependent enzyme
VNADQLNALVRQHLFQSGHAVIGHTRVRNQQCLKFTCMNPTVTDSQMEAYVQEILKVSNTIA